MLTDNEIKEILKSEHNAYEVTHSLVEAALEAGAFDVMCKPGASYSVNKACVELVEKIKYASRAKIKQEHLYL